MTCSLLDFRLDAESCQNLTSLSNTKHNKAHWSWEHVILGGRHLFQTSNYAVVVMKMSDFNWFKSKDRINIKTLVSHFQCLVVLIAFNQKNIWVKVHFAVINQIWFRFNSTINCLQCHLYINELVCMHGRYPPSRAGCRGVHAKKILHFTKGLITWEFSP